MHETIKPEQRSVRYKLWLLNLWLTLKKKRVFNFSLDINMKIQSLGVYFKIK